MSEEKKVDKTIVELDSKNEKISELEEKVKSFEKAEQERLAKIKEEEEKSIQERLAKVEEDKKAMAESFEKKLEDIKMRASTAGNPNEKETSKLTKEEYEKNRIKYDTMYLKATLPDVFN